MHGLAKVTLVRKRCPGRFGMLKVFMVSQDVSAKEVEERYSSWVEQLRTDRYVTAGTRGNFM